ncbi:hypothetical protein LZ31DRAFT_164983 [Colletotrichum somersetense]|nr:hypothetical protein LZ31DRAFT_164983 [Colletotrichum somersetense]
MSQPVAEWTQDIVLLPEVSEMPNLKAILGIKEQKLGLQNEAVPGVFSISISSSRPLGMWPPSCGQSRLLQGNMPKYDGYSVCLEDEIPRDDHRLVLGVRTGQQQLLTSHLSSSVEHAIWG